MAWATPGFQLLKIPLPPRTELLPTYRNISTFMSDATHFTSWTKRIPWMFPGQMNDFSAIPAFDPNLLAICHTFDFPSSLKNIEGMRSDEPSSYPSMLAQLRFSDEVERIRGSAYSLFRRSFANGNDRQLLQHVFSSRRPPATYISMHMRRGDFCKDRIDCTPPAYIKLFETGLASLLNNPSCSLDRNTAILVSVEETDPAFLAMLADRKWKVVDHGSFGTLARKKSDGTLLDGWWPPVLDQAVLAGATAFVGTKYSTFSGLSQMRVQAWNKGCTVLV